MSDTGTSTVTETTEKPAWQQESELRTKELTEKLQTGMQELYDSDKYKAYLKSMAQFHHYSPKNIMLIHMQMPDATRVASFKHWNEKFNRNVKKGEKGLYIYAPTSEKVPEKKMMEKLDPDTGVPLLDENGKVIMEEMTELTRGVRFKLVPVFDISQTYGEPLPELVENITGKVNHYDTFMDALKAVSPLPVEFEALPEAQDGYCRYGEKIGIRENMSETQTISALVHEINHAILHDKSSLPDNVKPKSKTVIEIEAESISYVVCQYFGIETSPNSFGYLAEYGSRDMSELNASLDTIRKEANNLIIRIDDAFESLCNERGIDLTSSDKQEIVQDSPHFEDDAFDDTIFNVSKSIESQNYQKLAELFPSIMSGEFFYQKSEAGTGFMPLSLEWIEKDKPSLLVILDKKESKSREQKKAQNIGIENIIKKPIKPKQEEL